MNIIQRTIRFLLIAFACSLVFFSNVYPAAAYGSTKTKPTDGEANLNDIQRMTDTSVTDPPLTIKEVQKRTQGGPNEVQGAADLDKMKNPENAKGKSFVEDVKDALDNVAK